METNTGKTNLFAKLTKGELIIIDTPTKLYRPCDLYGLPKPKTYTKVINFLLTLIAVIELPLFQLKRIKRIDPFKFKI